MRNFIIRRVILGLFISFFGAMLSYTVIRSLPTSYVESVARQRASKITQHFFCKIDHRSSQGVCSQLNLTHIQIQSTKLPFITVLQQNS